MNLECYEKVPAKNIAIEILLKNQKPPMFFQYFFWTFAQFLVFAVQYYFDKPIFVNDYQKYIFWL